MSQSNFHFQRRKSVADFLSENLPNQILHATVKESSDLPDEDILKAFNDAYGICLEVLAAPDLNTARSETYETMTDGITYSTLVSLSFAYFLLSFHQDAPKLRRYLSNLKRLLEKRLPDFFHPIYIAATSMASLIPGSSSFGYPISQSFLPRFYEPRQLISVQHIMLKAKERKKEECIIVLDTLREAIQEASGDWAKIIENEIRRISQSKDPAQPFSKYRIGKNNITSFIKIMRVCCEMRIIEEDNGLFVQNMEKFIVALGRFFNTEIKNYNNMLSEAKNRDFLKLFDEMRAAAEVVLTKGDSLDEQRKRQMSRNRKRGLENELF